MNKNVFISGASHGIGAAIARRFAKEGAVLFLNCAHSIDALKELETELVNTYGITCYTFQADVGDAAQVHDMFTQIHALTSKRGIDILINNAGIAHIGLLSDFTSEEWDYMIANNLSSVFYCSKEVFPEMIHKKEGKIINISSVWGIYGASCEVAYSAAKGGVNSFTKALAKELAPSNIQVNAIACGVIDTRMNGMLNESEREELMEEIPAGRFGQPEEVADLVYDISTGHNYLTGQIITLDGGWI